jgi:hypothetical protein
VQAFALLAVSATKDTAGSLDASNALLLLDWGVEAATGPKEDIVGPLPLGSKTRQVWLSPAQLTLAGAVLCSFESNARAAHAKALGWHWRPLAPAEPADGGKGGKKGKGDAVAAAISDSEVECGDPGILPPMLLRVDAAQYYMDKGIDAPTLTLTVFLHLDLTKTKSGSNNHSGNGSETASAENAENATESESQESHWSFGEARLVLAELQPSALASGEKNPQPPLRLGCHLAAGADAGGLPMLAATFDIPYERASRRHFDLGDFTSDSSFTAAARPQPLVFLVELDTQASVYATFHSDTALALGNPSQLWTPAGLGLLSDEGLAAAAAENNPEAETGEGGKSSQLVFSRSGHQAPTPKGSSFLLFRQPLGLRLGLSSVSSSASVTTTATASTSTSTSTSAVVCVHTPSRAVSRLLAASLVDVSSDSQVELPRRVGQGLQWGPTAEPLLLATTADAPTPVPAVDWTLDVLYFRPINSNVTSAAGAGAEAETTKTTTRGQREGLKSGREDFVRRVGAKYAPNSALRLFRDVYTVDKDFFPLALRVQAEPLATDSEHSDEDAAPMEVEGALAPAPAPVTATVPALDVRSLPLILRVIRGYDGALVSEHRGRGGLLRPYVDITGLLPDGYGTAEDVTLPAARAPPAAEATGGKGGKGGKGGGGDGSDSAIPQGSGEMVEFILECCVDAGFTETAHLADPDSPLGLFSALPYDFHAGTGTAAPNNPDDAQPGAVTDASIRAEFATAGAVPSFKFDWRVDVLGGVVSAVRHDTQQIEATVAAQRLWASAEGQEDRFDRAVAALAYCQAKASLLQRQETQETQETQTQTQVGDEAAATAATVQPSEEMLQQLSIALGSRASVTPEDLAGPETVCLSMASSKARPFLQPVSCETFSAEARERDNAMVAQTAAEDKVYVESFESTKAALGDKFFAALAQRSEALLAQHESDRAALRGVVERRDAYREVVLRKNEALAYVLARAATDMESTLEGGGDAKDKKKKKKK